MILLLFVTITVPIRLAFYESDTTTWKMINLTIDLFFLADIILTFFSTYLDEANHLEIKDHKKIANRYLKSWFLLDVTSVLPIDIILKSGKINHIARIIKIGKLYQLIKMVRMVRFLKMLRDRNRISSNLDNMLSISASFERLNFFLLIFALYLHVTSCLFIFCEQFTEGSNWVEVQT